jgi:VCBS repeat-containing protein
MNDDVRRFFGKYRGVVADTADPSNLGRIKVTLDNFPAAVSGWCMPCVPYAGTNVGWFVIPEKGAHVWVEFEGGDPSLPIWVGCFWEAGTIPPTATASRKIWQTPTCKVVLDDKDGKAGELQIESTTRSGETVYVHFDTTGISLKAKTAEIIMAMDDGITIKYPQSTIQLTAQQVLASEGQASSFKITAQDQTLQTATVNVQATNQLSVTASASTSVTTGSYSLKGSTITFQAGAINIG